MCYRQRVSKTAQTRLVLPISGSASLLFVSLAGALGAGRASVVCLALPVLDRVGISASRCAGSRRREPGDERAPRHSERRGDARGGAQHHQRLRAGDARRCGGAGRSTRLRSSTSRTRIQARASGSPAIVKTAWTSGMSSRDAGDLVDRRGAGEAQLGEGFERPAELGVVDADGVAEDHPEPLEAVDAPLDGRRREARRAARCRRAAAGRPRAAGGRGSRDRCRARDAPRPRKNHTQNARRRSNLASQGRFGRC